MDNTRRVLSKATGLKLSNSQLVALADHATAYSANTGAIDGTKLVNYLIRLALQQQWKDASCAARAVGSAASAATLAHRAQQAKREAAAQEIDPLQLACVDVNCSTADLESAHDKLRLAVNQPDVAEMVWFRHPELELTTMTAATVFRFLKRLLRVQLSPKEMGAIMRCEVAAAVVSERLVTQNCVNGCFQQAPAARLRRL